MSDACRAIRSRRGCGPTRASRQPRFDLVHATAFPYAWPIVCGLRLARRQGIPFLLTPFLHLGDPDDPNDRTRRATRRRHCCRWSAPPTACSCRPRSNATPCCERGIRRGQTGPARHGRGAGRMHRRRPAARPPDWGLADDEVVVGHLANNSVEKGTVDLLQAARTRLAAGATASSLLLAGPQMPNFRRFWESYPDAARVRLPRPSAATSRNATSSPALTCSPCRAVPTRSAWSCWKRGPTACRTWLPGRRHCRGHPARGRRACWCAAAIWPGWRKRWAGWWKMRNCGGDWVRRDGNARRREFRWEDKLETVRETYLTACGFASSAKPQAADLHSITSSPPAATLSST